MTRKMRKQIEAATAKAKALENIDAMNADPAQSESFTVGDRVRFRENLDPGDEACLFDVCEDNGDRLMIRLVCDLPIRPVSVIMRADLCRAEG